MPRKKRWILWAVSCALLVGCLGGCKVKGGDSFGFSLSAEPQHLDPQVASDAASLAVIEAAFESLTRLDENGNVTAGAASFAVSDDGLTYTFTLKTSCWSTVSVRGEQTGFEQPVMVTADDFVYGIRRTAAPATASPHAKLLAGIQNAPAVCNGEKPLSALGVQAIDAQTLTITLSAPDADFLKKTATPAFMPCNEEFFNYTAGRYGLEKEYILSNGAFAVSGWSHNESVSLRKNEHYHDAAAIMPASVKYAISKSEQEDFELLKKGALDASPVPEQYVEDAVKAGISLVGLQDTVQYLWFNTTAPLLQDARVRRAIAQAIEWDVVWENLPAGYEKATGYIPPAATVGGKPYTATDTMQTQVQAAKQSLQAADLQVAPTFTLLCANDNETANLSRYIAQCLSKNLGVHCQLELVDEKTLAARVQAGNYEMAIYAAVGVGLTAKENLGVFTSTAPRGNYARFADADYDRLYQTVGDDAEAVAQLSAHLKQTVPALPLGFYTRYYGVSPDAAGILVRAFNGGAYGAPLSFNGALLD